MEYSNNRDIKAGFRSIIGANDYGIGIAATRCFQVFYPDNTTAIVAGSALLNQLGSDGIVFLGTNLHNSKREILVRQDLDVDRQRRSGLALQVDLGGTDLDEFNDFSGYNKTEEGLCRVVGLHIYRFPLLPSAIVAGIEFDCNTSFLPGKDLPRTCRSRTASAGFDVYDIQRCIALIEQNKLMHNLRPFRHRLEFEDIFGKVCLRPGWRIGCRSMAKVWRQADQSEQKQCS
jgi:hypothetical protein